MATETCGYHFDPAVWSRKHGRPSPVREEWSCPRSAVEGGDRCPFHLSPTERRIHGIDPEVVTRSLRESIESSTGDPSLRFIGATLDTVDLSTAVIGRDTNEPLDLRHATVLGDIDLTGATVRQPVLLEETTVSGGLDCSDATFSHSLSSTGLSVAAEARFENATFENAVDFTAATFGNRVSFTGAIFERDADFYRVRASGNVRFQNTEWRMGCQFRLATFDGRADFHSSRFGGRCDFREASFGGVARFSKSTFEGDVLFLGTEFDREALFKKIAFGSNVHFQNAAFDTEASFSETEFHGKTKFQFATFRGEASISYATFRGNAYFQHARFTDYVEFFECRFEEIADFRWTEFHDVSRFMDAQFAAEAYFSNARFFDVADFRDARFDHAAVFHTTAFECSPMFQRATIETIDLVDVESNADDLTIDIRAGRVRHGRIQQTNGFECYYDVSEAVLGDVDLDIDTTDRPFDSVLISRTAFDGFDFSRYHYALSPDWDLHRFAGRVGLDHDTEASRFQLGDTGETKPKADVDERTLEDEGGRDAAPSSRQSSSGVIGRSVSTVVSGIQSAVPGPDTLVDAPDRETTYLKAKNGANEVGDSRAASAFFIREMYYRRYAHVKRALDDAEAYRTRARSGLLATMNWLLSISCGYGEKPYRTLSFSVLVVAFYALVYSVVLDAPPSGSASGYALFSFQSFTALILGIDTEPFGFTASFVAASQGFVGAFLIGLFVFTLTRSIHR